MIVAMLITAGMAIIVLIPVMALMATITLMIMIISNVMIPT